METIQLQHPVTIEGTEIKHLNLRRPKVRDLRNAEKAGKGAGNAETEIRLFANLCEVTPETIEELDLADYGRLQKAYEGFLSGQERSEPPAPS